MNSWIFKTPIAHRGLHNSVSPENSLSSFKNAIKKKHAIELDVRFTADGKIIVFHDKTTERLTDKSLIVHETNLEDLTKLKIGNSKETIPTLEKSLSTINGQVPILIEIKNEYEVGPLEKELVKQLKSYPHKFAIQSFNPWSLKEIKKLDPKIEVGLLSGSFSKSSLGGLSKFVLKNLLLVPYVAPDFLSLEYESFSGFQKTIANTFNSKKIIFWTIRDQERSSVLKRLNVNFIYEGIEL